MKYIKKQVEIEAIQLNKNNILDVYRFINGECSVKLNCKMAIERWDEYEDSCIKSGGIRLKTMESHNETQIASFGDFIIKGVEGEFYPCNQNIFYKTYDKK